MNEQHECELMCDSIATTIDDAKDRGLSLVAVNVVLLEKTLEKLIEHGPLKKATEALSAEQAIRLREMFYPVVYDNEPDALSLVKSLNAYANTLKDG